MDSPVILADEPTGSLDRNNTDSVMEIFQDIHQKGKTILIVTHDEHVASYCQRTLHIGDV
jgi:putative ABC transport system ATP-binding protein